MLHEPPVVQDASHKYKYDVDPIGEIRGRVLVPGIVTVSFVLSATYQQPEPRSINSRLE